MNNGLFQQQPDMTTQYSANTFPYMLRPPNMLLPPMPQPSNTPKGGDMSVMQAQDPQQGAPMPMLEDTPENADSVSIPTYIGNPILDKYIHQFIGSV